MSHHSTNFEADQEVPAGSIEGLPTGDHNNVVAIAAPKARNIKGQLRRLLLAGAAVAVLSGAVWYGWDYWTVGRFLVSTDDAYVKADNTTIAPKVSGYLSQVMVGDNERVKAGQVLARIDDRDFVVALDQAKADVAAAKATVASKQAQLDVQEAVIAAAKATIEVDTATKTFAGQENKRYTDVAATGYGSVQNAQAAQSRSAGAEAAIQRDQANLVSALKQVDLIKAELAQAVAASARAAALQRQAELNLGYTTITAPIDGVVDMFPGHVVHGHVDSLAPASGQEFALLPPDNATGNFTKVVQRIPVKIALEGGAPIELRPGMSVIPTIETQAHQLIVAKAPQTSQIAYAASQR